MPRSLNLPYRSMSKGGRTRERLYFRESIRAVSIIKHPKAFTSSESSSKESPGDIRPDWLCYSDSHSQFMTMMITVFNSRNRWPFGKKIDR